MDVSAQVLEGIEHLLKPIPETLRKAIIKALPLINVRIEKEQE